MSTTNPKETDMTKALKTTGDKKRAARERSRACKAGKLSGVCSVCGDEIGSDLAMHNASPWHIANMDESAS